MTSLLIALLFFVSAPVPALAASMAPDYALRWDERASLLIATPPPKHHFNIEAPAFIEITGKKIKPGKLSQGEVHFIIPSTTSIATTHLFICDDPSTFCERVSFAVTWSEDRKSIQVKRTTGTRPMSGVAAPLVTPSVASSVASSVATEELHSDGFIMNDPSKAFALARKKNRPMFIDFFGIWCPPCNLLDSEVFSSSEFKHATRDFILLKLDVDAPVSWEFKSRYKVGGYPTLIFTDSKGSEISRLVGYRPKKQVVSEIENAWTLRDQSTDVLAARSEVGDRDSLDRLGQWHYERREYDQAIDRLKDTVQFKKLLFAAQINRQKKILKSDPSETAMAGLQTLLKQAIMEFPLTADALDWRSTLAESFGEAKDPASEKQTYEDLLKAIAQMIKNPSLFKGEDLTQEDLYSIQAGTYESLDQPENAKTAWSKAARQIKKRTHHPLDRAAHLDLAYCLWKSGDTAGATKIYTRFEKAFPKEFTFFYAHAQMHVSKKEYDLAEPLARRAQEHSYGDNRLRASNVLAKILIAQNKKTEATQLLDQSLEQTKLPEDSSLRTHTYYKTLKDLRATL